MLMQQCGLDDIWTCAFTPELARLEPEEFIRLVSERQPIAELWVGPDFALGRGRRGTIAVLSEMGGAAGWALHMVPPYRHEGQIVSSSGIRTLLSAGAVRGAGDLLGRPYSLSGELDSQNIVRVDPLHQLPRPGVYAGQARQPGTILDATITVLAHPRRDPAHLPRPHRRPPLRPHRTSTSSAAETERRYPRRHRRRARRPPRLLARPRCRSSAATPQGKPLGTLTAGTVGFAAASAEPMAVPAESRRERCSLLQSAEPRVPGNLRDRRSANAAAGSPDTQRCQNIEPMLLRLVLGFDFLLVLLDDARLEMRRHGVVVRQPHGVRPRPWVIDRKSVA